MKHISILELFLIFMKLWLLKEEEGKLLKNQDSIGLNWKEVQKSISFWQFNTVRSE